MLEFDEVKASLDCPAQYLPSAWQFAQVGQLVQWEDGCDPAGNFIGHCIIHADEREVEISAEYNFDRGVMRCYRSPACHAPKRAMSIVNAVKRAEEASE